MLLFLKSDLKASLYRKDIVNIVPTIAGSNRDEVKLWLATAEYFVELIFLPLDLF